MNAREVLGHSREIVVQHLNCESLFQLRSITAILISQLIEVEVNL